MENKEFKFEEHFKPLANGVVLKELNKLKAGDVTDSGLMIGAKLPSSTPEADVDKEDESLKGFIVMATGPDCTRVKVGDIVSVSGGAMGSLFSIFGDDYIYTLDYLLIATLSSEALALNNKMNEERKEKERTVRIEAFKREKLLLDQLSNKKIN